VCIFSLVFDWEKFRLLNGGNCGFFLKGCKSSKTSSDSYGEPPAIGGNAEHMAVAVCVGEDVATLWDVVNHE
jgi:hypothetical protein